MLNKISALCSTWSASSIYQFAVIYWMPCFRNWAICLGLFKSCSRCSDPIIRDHGIFFANVKVSLLKLPLFKSCIVPALALSLYKIKLKNTIVFTDNADILYPYLNQKKKFNKYFARDQVDNYHICQYSVNRTKLKVISIAVMWYLITHAILLLFRLHFCQEQKESATFTFPFLLLLMLLMLRPSSKASLIKSLSIGVKGWDQRRLKFLKPRVWRLLWFAHRDRPSQARSIINRTGVTDLSFWRLTRKQVSLKQYSFICDTSYL